MKYVIGLDIGGTKITGVVFDGKTIVRELTVPTPKNLKVFQKSLGRLIDLLSEGRHISGVGMGIAGVINSRGAIVFSPNLKYLIGFSPERFLKKKKIKNIRVENDANCFALGEAHFGKGKAYKNFIGLTLGTGIGGGIILNKKLYYGSHQNAGEAGHIMADFKFDSEHYFQLARNAKDFKTLGGVVGILFANIANLLDVDAIVLGGSVAQKHYKKFMPAALRKARQHVVNKNALPKIIISHLQNAAGLGAALLLKDVNL